MKVKIKGFDKKKSEMLNVRARACRAQTLITQGKRSATLGLEPTFESWQSGTMIEIIRSMPRNTKNQIICN